MKDAYPKEIIALNVSGSFGEACVDESRRIRPNGNVCLECIF